MNEQNTKKLIENHKYMFAEMERRQAEINSELAKVKAVGVFYPIAFGFECDDGWFELLDNLMDEIKKIDVNRSVSVHQVKEKFGGLRFYIEGGNEEVDNLIDEAEEKSYKICEICGKEGELCVASHWYKTVCNDHRVETNYKPVTNGNKGWSSF